MSKKNISKPNAQELHNPSREYISHLLDSIQENIPVSQVAKLIGVNRSTIYNYLRDEDDKRFTPCPYVVQFALEELLKNIRKLHEK
ncbi:XRE family transcriptional regulator [Haemophilus pittmaniae]|uniref:XRE family transcriptional regulator n=1 Tax=Haemophilus pittmaniae TaxID=249188 RepID=UPI0028DD3CD9|nr:XRE family transcriptional regulator [Haemophilus pittmaniae]